MKERRNQANYYVTAIIEDVRNRFVREETVTFSEKQIIREYEFEDGAIIKYEWQQENTGDENFNHRFTMTRLPNPNPADLEIGVIKTVAYPKR